MPKPEEILPIPWNELYEAKNDLGTSLLPVKHLLSLRPLPLSFYRGLTPIGGYHFGSMENLSR